MLDAIISIAMWFFLITGVITWLVIGLCIWFYNMDRR